MQKLRRHPHWLICFISIFIVSLYWNLWASDRYVSEANVVLESPQISAPTLNFSSLLSGGGASSGDMLLLRDHLLSVDMLRKIETKLGFRKHYSNIDMDAFSRLADEEAPIEDLHEYYLERISVELDSYAQVLRVKVEAFSPEMAKAIADGLLLEGELHMNAMGQRLAEEQVLFLEKQVNQLSERFDLARQALLDHQNQNGLVSPTGTVESLNVVVAGLESQLTDLKAKRSTISSYQSAVSPQLVQINNQIVAINEQIGLESARMARQSGNSLNAVSSQYQTLELKAHFAQESYSGALSALENTRIEAARKLKQVSVLQNPTLPEYPIKPERLYNTAVFAIIALFLGLILHMLVIIVKDHKD
tara:strand:- start:14311 stop:15396 length:1086 start_codon:yes stop_codon:yes gene_type:complete